MIRAIVLHRLHRVLADRGLAGEHHRVGAVEHRVGHVGGLGPGGPGVLDHRLEHLGGDDDRLGVLPGHLDGALLHQRHLLQRQLDAEVTAGDHDRVEGQHDGLEVVDRLRLLQLGDHRHAAADPVHHLVDELDVGGRAHERQRDQVDAEPQRELQVVDVLLATAPGTETFMPGSDMPLLLLTVPPSVTVQTTSLPSMCSTTRPTLPSSTSSRSPGVASCGEPLVGGGDPVVGALDVLDGDPHRLAGAPTPCGPSANRPSRIFGPCRSARMPTARPVGVGRGPDPLVDRLVVGVVAVAEVQPGDVHPGLDQRARCAPRSAVAGPSVQTIFPRLVTAPEHSR